MFDEEGVLPHFQAFLSFVVFKIPDFSAAEGMSMEEVLIYQDGESVLIGRARRKYALFLWLIESFHDFRRHKVGGSKHVGREETGDDKTVKVDNACRTRLGVDQTVFVGEIAVRQSCGVEAADSLSQF